MQIKTSVIQWLLFLLWLGSPGLSQASDAEALEQDQIDSTLYEQDEPLDATEQPDDPKVWRKLKPKETPVEPGAIMERRPLRPDEQLLLKPHPDEWTDSGLEPGVARPSDEKGSEKTSQ